jgi:hypothetical protein
LAEEALQSQPERTTSTIVEPVAAILLTRTGFPISAYLEEPQD